MDTLQYNEYKKQLLKAGYKYYPDEPYEGRNTWMKFIVKEEKRKAFIRLDEYSHADPDSGKMDYRLNAHGVVRDDDCDIVLTIKFSQLNVEDMELSVNDYYKRLFND